MPSETIDMGNVWRKFTRRSKDPSTPCTLEELLSPFSSSGHLTADPASVDAAIEDCAWARRFLAHLEGKGLDDEAAALRFLVFTQPMVRRKESPSCESFVNAVGHFFGEDAPCQVSLSNPRLAEALLEASSSKLNWSSSSVAAADVVSHADLNLLSRARTDPDVWADGLETKYGRFLAEEAEKVAAPVACILSIL